MILDPTNQPSLDAHRGGAARTKRVLLCVFSVSSLAHAKLLPCISTLLFATGAEDAGCILFVSLCAHICNYDLSQQRERIFTLVARQKRGRIDIPPHLQRTRREKSFSTFARADFARIVRAVSRGHSRSWAS